MKWFAQDAEETLRIGKEFRASLKPDSIVCLFGELGAGKTTFVRGIAEGLEIGFPSEHPTWIFNGVAVGPSGAIYVTGDIANVLYRIEPGEGGK